MRKPDEKEQQTFDKPYNLKGAFNHFEMLSMIRLHHQLL